MLLRRNCFLSDDDKAWRTAGGRAKRFRVVHPANLEPGFGEPAADFIRAVSSFVDTFDDRAAAIGASLASDDSNHAGSRFPLKSLVEPAPGRAMIAREDFVSVRRLAGCQNIEIEMAARAQICHDAPEGTARIGRVLQMVERVEVCRDQIDP